MAQFLVALAMAAVLLTGCTTIRKTHPDRTATQELLLSTAADHAARKIYPNLPRGSKIYVDATDFAGDYGTQYAVSRITDQLLRDQYQVVDSRSDADFVAQIRSGSLSINERSQLWFGVPSATLPIPLTGPIETPELPFYKTATRKGIAKFAITFYVAKTGALTQSLGPIYGFSHRNHTTIFFYTKTKSDLLPKNTEELY